MKHHVHDMPFGATVRSEGECDFSLWAPASSEVSLLVDGRTCESRPMGDGWWRARAKAAAGSRYQWVVDRRIVPDPASRSNPGGPHESSEVVDPSKYEWQSNWPGRPWTDTAAYQLHVGTFTQEGSYAAAMRRLPHLAELGITAIQLMPVATFAGQFGWGYDGVLIYAPNPAYGTPDDLKAFVDHAHLHGLMVFLDVVYNHFGPDGNFLPSYAPQFESAKHETPWGRAMNFDGEGAANVREFMIQNALYWLEEFQFDGLRLDAVHAMVDDSAHPIIEELTRRARAAHPKRQVHIILENDHNNPQRLGFPEERCEGQWNGDFHHCLHVLLTGESKSYYGEYVDDPIGRLARVLTLGFSRQGAEEPRPGRLARQDATSTISLVNSVNFLQCHDHIGNRAFGERLNALAPAQALPLASALLILSPPIPMIFMGEEFGSNRPFLYFADVKPELREPVRAGRREEFRDAPGGDRAHDVQPPDPCSRESFLASVVEAPDDLDLQQRVILDRTRRLFAVRHGDIAPHLPRLTVGGHRHRRIGDTGLHVAWSFSDGRILNAVVNLGNQPMAREDGPGGRASARATLFDVGRVSADSLGPWSGTWYWCHRDE